MYRLTHTSTTTAGVLLGTVGAILHYAVTATVSGVDLDTVGVILMAAGATIVVMGLIGALLEGAGTVREDRVVEIDSGEMARRKEREHL